MKVFHIALESEWRAAERTGTYTTSTLGRSLEEEGFIHTSRADQVKAVSARYYAGVRKPLVRLQIDTDKLTSPWREDPVGEDTYPHIYGPLNVAAVTAVRPWHRVGREKTFLEVFLAEAMVRILLAIGVMLLAGAGSAIGDAVGDSIGTHGADGSATGAVIGAFAGLAVGAGLFVIALRRLDH
ncbi:conserved hypothetical protein [metagenome]|uniref:DUF952 domain-containing protein n=1 Tax=metagenome TaxID=256318 RepID=A0A2P2C5J8_9ZZZZ